MLLAELQNLLNDKIPITKEMGGEIISVDPFQLILKFPLHPNRNHKGTLFGGSLYSGSALACYGLFLWNLRQEGIASDNIVIGEGTIKYLKPVDHNAEIVAHWGTDEARPQFFDSLKRRGKACVEMKAQILVGGNLCAIFIGSFVALNEKKSD